ncbi:DNA-binding transcriptional regulator, LysR family [Cohaesibacter sp. ES.047]|uniref:LysR family transcriptional regulator n=1 Tax=Cohaesibacter sp. ES.047 TaxID=1798205 RepID=UPI000BB75C72|nr:LysR family transcriptional regulator [Cohaesibacter sp. ES.047]SNY92596.1 DNA-binding transcriptional regulator, LysR family [Cohaesibacter sp. ES.047]
MKNIDYLSLDGRSLYMLKLIYEHRSVTETARILGVTQSSVSHSLDRLRSLLGDPLFIKVGRSMVPTERVEAMAPEIDQVLENFEALFHQTEFDPFKSKDRFSIVCNDFEHDLIVPSIFERLKREAPDSTLRTHQQLLSGNMHLKSGMADLELCPFPPEDSSDIVVTKLCSDRSITYYDPTQRDAPCTVDEFSASEHAILAFGNNETTNIDQALGKLGHTRRVAYIGPTFNSAAMVVRGTRMLVTGPSRMASTIFRDLAWVETPFELEPTHFYMVWHVRNRHSPRHKWFRELVKSVARDLPEISEACQLVLAKQREMAELDSDTLSSASSVAS